MRRNAKEFAVGDRIFIAFLQKLGLLDNLTGIREKLHPITGQGDSLGIADKDLNAHFIFQISHCIGETWLSDKELLGCLIHGASFDDFDNIM
ncbi:Uncharacterised protein [Streptococcus pneumoniae]|nr:Uncharacterised protein [Streptococcus pneumoniae]